MVEEQHTLADNWHRALERIIADGRASRPIAGMAARLLYEANRLSSEDTVALLSRMLSPGVPVFACTPDQFPDLMACALRPNDIHQWAALQDIKAIRETDATT